jgi:hypothetical protein
MYISRVKELLAHVCVLALSTALKMLTSIGLAAFLAVLASASPLQIRTPYAVKESHPVPRKWSRVGPAPAEHVINLQIGLKQGNFNELERHLYEGEYFPRSQEHN